MKWCGCNTRVKFLITDDVANTGYILFESTKKFRLLAVEIVEILEKHFVASNSVIILEFGII